MVITIKKTRINSFNFFLFIELIDAIKKTDDINEHALSEETENKEWFNQFPIENQTITLEVPIVNFPPKIDHQFSKGISCRKSSFFCLLNIEFGLCFFCSSAW